MLKEIKWEILRETCRIQFECLFSYLLNFHLLWEEINKKVSFRPERIDKQIQKGKSKKKTYHYGVSYKTKAD